MPGHPDKTASPWRATPAALPDIAREIRRARRRSHWRGIAFASCLRKGAPAAIPCGKRRMVPRKSSRPGRIRNGFRIRRNSLKRAGQSTVCRNTGASKQNGSPWRATRPPSPTSPVKFAAQGAGRTGAALLRLPFPPQCNPAHTAAYGSRLNVASMGIAACGSYRKRVCLWQCPPWQRGCENRTRVVCNDFAGGLTRFHKCMMTRRRSRALVSPDAPQSGASGCQKPWESAREPTPFRAFNRTRRHVRRRRGSFCVRKSHFPE